MKNLKISTKKWKIKKQVEIIENKNSAFLTETAQILGDVFQTEKWASSTLLSILLSTEQYYICSTEEDTIECHSYIYWNWKMKSHFYL